MVKLTTVVGLAAIVGVVFVGFQNRQAFADVGTSIKSRLTRQQQTITPPTQTTEGGLIEPTEGMQVLGMPTQPFIISPKRTVTGATLPPARPVQPRPARGFERRDPSRDRRVTRQQPQILIDPRQPEKPDVLRPSFLAPEERRDPETFKRRKFGIDRKKSMIAEQKQESRRTNEEKKRLAADRARKQFDSRKITNF